MFDAVLKQGYQPKRRLGTAGIASLAAHALLVAGLIAGVTQEPERIPGEGRPITFPKDKTPEPSKDVTPPPPKVPKTKGPKITTDIVVAPTSIPTMRPIESDITVGPSTGGEDVENAPGGKYSVVETDGLDLNPIVFNAGTMTEPTYVSGPNPEYTQKALEREVQGLMVVKCTVTAAGTVENCRVVVSLPYLDRAVITALEARHYSPAMLGGQPVTVDYEFRLRMQLPE